MGQASKAEAGSKEGEVEAAGERQQERDSGRKWERESVINFNFGSVTCALFAYDMIEGFLYVGFFMCPAYCSSPLQRHKLFI